MKKNKIVPIRLTEIEYAEIIDCAEKDGCANVSVYIREKIFSARKEKTYSRDLVMEMRLLRSEIRHALTLYQKDFLSDAQIELESCNKKLEELQKAVVKKWQ